MEEVQAKRTEEFGRLEEAVRKAMRKIPKTAFASATDIAVFVALLTDTARRLAPRTQSEIEAGSVTTMSDLSNLPRLPKLIASMRGMAAFVRDKIYREDAYKMKSPRVLRSMHLVFRYLGSERVWVDGGARETLSKT